MGSFSVDIIKPNGIFKPVFWRLLEGTNKIHQTPTPGIKTVLIVHRPYPQSPHTKYPVLLYIHGYQSSQFRNTENRRFLDPIFQIPGTGSSSSISKPKLNTQNRWLLKNQRTAPPPHHWTVIKNKNRPTAVIRVVLRLRNCNSQKKIKEPCNHHSRTFGKN